MSTSESTFRKLHIPGDPFVLANVWDVGSARMMASLGAQALASSSAAHAFTLGVADMGTVTRDQAIEHGAMLVEATPLPVNGDLENGFGDRPEEVAHTVRLAAGVGLAGCGIEDVRPPHGEVYPFEQAVERIEAAAAAGRQLDDDFVLTARADGIMLGQYGMDEAVRRIKAFERAGADVVYVPMPETVDDLKHICRAVDVPVNALCAGKFVNLSRLDFAELGVARISLGSSLARATHRILYDAGQAMFGSGDFSPLSNGIGSDLIDPLLTPSDMD